MDDSIIQQMLHSLGVSKTGRGLDVERNKRYRPKLATSRNHFQIDQDDGWDIERELFLESFKLELSKMIGRIDMFMKDFNTPEVLNKIDSGFSFAKLLSGSSDD